MALDNQSIKANKTWSEHDHKSALNTDRELNGEVNRAANQGAKFSLLMAMLEPNHLYRPKIENPEHLQPDNHAQLPSHHYRSCPLGMNQQGWAKLDQTSRLIGMGLTQSAQLWLAMHPEPLSQFNDNSQLPVEVKVNCSFQAQSRLHNNMDNEIQTDETALFDILQSIEPQAA